MKTKIYLKETYFTSVNSNAGVFYGENILKGWKSSSKSNSAIVRIYGDGNSISSRLNYVDDRDFQDSVTQSKNP